MKVFLDFEASSLSDRSYPVEVAWVFQDGRAKSHLIRPAPEWSDWDGEAEAIHGISRETLADEGRPHDLVAARMVEALSGHDLFASAEWSDWDGEAEAIHGISRETLADEGRPHDLVAARMVEALSGHDLFASAPSWDGKWLSVLVRSASLPRHALRLCDTDEALRSTAAEILRPVLPSARLDIEVHALVSAANAGKQAHPAQRTLAHAQVEYETWYRLRQAARELAAQSDAA